MVAKQTTTIRVGLKHLNHGYAVKTMSDDTEMIDTDDVKVEEEALKETPLDAIKSQIMDKYGFNEEDHSEIIAKMAEEKMEDKKKLSSAIKQKIKLREKFNAVKPVEKKEPAKSDVDIDALVEAKLNEKLDAKEIESSDLSDDLKKQVKNYAKLNEVSIKEALKSDYIQYQVKKEEEKDEIDDASISSKHDKPKANKDFKNMDPKDFDVSSEEGRQQWEDYKQSLRG
jgi:hypothetical protein